MPQPGLIKVGELIPSGNPSESNGLNPPMNPNPRCACCPEPPPQKFQFARLPNLKRKATVEDMQEGQGDLMPDLSYADAWAWFNANIV